jgi:hypothetical protein
MGFRGKFLRVVSGVICFALLAVMTLVAVIIETITVVLVGIIMGLITNKYPKWAKYKITRFMWNKYLNFQILP